MRHNVLNIYCHVSHLHRLLQIQYIQYILHASDAPLDNAPYVPGTACVMCPKNVLRHELISATSCSITCKYIMDLYTGP